MSVLIVDQIAFCCVCVAFWVKELVASSADADDELMIS